MNINSFCLCGDDSCFYYHYGMCDCEFPEEEDCPYFDDEEEEW